MSDLMCLKQRAIHVIIRVVTLEYTRTGELMIVKVVGAVSAYWVVAMAVEVIASRRA